MSDDASDYRPGDIVVCYVGGKRPHIMIVSDRVSPSGLPYVIHNIGRGTVENEDLFSYPIKAVSRVKE